MCRKKQMKIKWIETKKDVHKLIRSICEAVVMIAVVCIILRAFLVIDRYDPYDKNDVNIVSGDDKGFLCISYFGIDRTGTNVLVSTKNLEKQLTALHNSGYVTISQQDVIDYYEREGPSG